MFLSSGSAPLVGRGKQTSSVFFPRTLPLIDMIYSEAAFAQTLTLTLIHNRRPVNKVLRSATTFLCPKSAVADRILLGRYQRQPLRRYTSELDLRTASRGLGAPRPQDNETSCSRQSIAFLDELVLNKVGYRHEVAEAGSTEVTSTSSSHSGDADECDANQTASANAPRNLIELNLIRKSLSIYSLFEETGSRGPIMSPRRHANFLVQRLKLNNPIFFAMQITSVDQGLLLQLHPAEVMQLVLGKQHSLVRLSVLVCWTIDLNVKVETCKLSFSFVNAMFAEDRVSALTFFSLRVLL